MNEYQRTFRDDPERPDTTHPPVDLVMLTWNLRDVLEPCVESILRYTRIPARLTIVDNGSDEETKTYLRSLRGNGRIQIRVMTNHVNEGFVRGMNRGIRAATAPYVCLMNNDMLVTRGWLEEMVAVGEAHDEIGVINPASNTFGQCPRRGESLEDFAVALKAQRGQYVEVGSCIGFCMLIKRDLIERIGGLDEGLQQFFFEDTDFSRRAQQAGYRCVVAKAAYVFHHEHRSLTRVKKREHAFAKNRSYYHGKWGRPLRVVYVLWADAPPSALDEVLLRVLDFARHGNFLYIWCARGAPSLPARYARHANVRWVEGPARAFRWRCLWRVLARRKKPYDVIVTHDARLARWCHRLRWLHDSEVAVTDEGEEFRRGWLRQSR